VDLVLCWLAFAAVTVTSIDVLILVVPLAGILRALKAVT